MASAGRILILPKGNYNSSITYEMLDLVSYGGKSWLAKKTVVGVTPSETESEYWFKFGDGVDLTAVNNRIQATEDRITALEEAGGDIDLSEYAKTSEVKAVSDDLDILESDVGTLRETVNGMSDSSAYFSNRNVLDYDNKVTRDHASLPYTCPSAGEVTVYIKISSSGGNLKIDKNGSPAAYLVGNTTGAPYVASTFPVAQGDVINRNGIAGNIDEGKIIFVPYKYQ